MQFATLLKKRDLLEDELKGLRAQSNKDESKIQEVGNELWEVRRELANFVSDIAQELYNIDIKGWADQIGDALINAFENGEDAAKAFEDATRSIMQSVVSNIIKIGLLEPMFKDLNDKLFVGYTDNEGVWHDPYTSYDKISQDPMGEGKRVADFVNNWFNSTGEAIITGVNEIYTGINAGLGGILTNPNTKTLSASIQGTTEQTSTLLAGYVNAARQDLAADRLMLEEFVSTLWPEYMNEYVKGLSQNVGLIQSDVRRIADAVAPEREDSLHSLIYSMNEILSGIKDGTVTVTMA